MSEAAQLANKNKPAGTVVKSEISFPKETETTKRRIPVLDENTEQRAKAMAALIEQYPEAFDELRRESQSDIERLQERLKLYSQAATPVNLMPIANLVKQWGGPDVTEGFKGLRTTEDEMKSLEDLSAKLSTAKKIPGKVDIERIKAMLEGYKDLGSAVKPSGYEEFIRGLQAGGGKVGVGPKPTTGGLQEKDIEKYVVDMGKQIGKDPVKLKNAIADLDELFPGGLSGKRKDVPGIGVWDRNIPRFWQSPTGNSISRLMQKIQNIELYRKSGKAVSANEKLRSDVELALSGTNPDTEVRRALQDYVTDLADELAVVEGWYPDRARELWYKRPGVLRAQDIADFITDSKIRRTPEDIEKRKPGKGKTPKDRLQNLSEMLSKEIESLKSKTPLMPTGTPGGKR